MSVHDDFGFQMRRIRRLVIVLFGRIGFWKLCYVILKPFENK